MKILTSKFKSPTESLKHRLLILAIPLFYTLLLIRPLMRTQSMCFGGDILLPFHPYSILEKLSSSFNWWGDFGSTLPPIFSFPSILESMIFAVFHEGLGLPFPYSFYGYLMILSLVSFISIYCLASTIFHNLEHRSIVSLIIPTLYLFNPVLFSGTYKSLLYLLFFDKSLFYLLIATIIHGFQSKSLKYALVGAAISFGTFIPTPVGTYHRIVFIIAFYLVLGMYFFLSEKRNKLCVVKFWLTFGLVFSAFSMLINLYWIFPFLIHLGEYFQLAAAHLPNFFFNKWSIIINAIRMLNSWGFWAGYVPYAEVYSTNKLIVILTFSWPLLVFSALLLSPRNKKVLALSILTLITLFFAKGNNPPFGGIYVDLVFLNIGGIYPFKAFYTTGAVTEHVLPIEYSVLAGYTIAKASRSVYRWLILRTQNIRGLNGIIKKMPKALLTVVLVVLLMTPIIISSWPILTSEVMVNYYPYQKFGVKYYGVSIPEDYYEANKVIVNDVFQSGYHQFIVRGLILPKMYIYVATDWWYQGTSAFYNYYFEVPIVTGNFIPYGITIPKEVIDKLYHLPLKTYNKSYSLTDMPIEKTIDLAPLLDVETAKVWQIGGIFVVNESIYINITKSDEIANRHYLLFSIGFKEVINLEDYEFLRLRINMSIPEQNVWIGLGDSKGCVEWWRTELHVFESVGDTKMLIMSLYDPERGDIIDLSKVKSFWIQIEPPRLGNITVSNISCVAIKPGAVIPKELPWTSFQNDVILKDADYTTTWIVNTSSYQGKWHQILLSLHSTQNWQSYNYLRIKLNTNNADISKLKIGVGCKNGFINWYWLKEYADPYLSSGNLLVANIPLVQASGPSMFDGKAVTSIWLGYYVEGSELHNPQVQISDIYICKAEVDDYLYAEQLASLNIAYIIIDKSVIEGVPKNLLGNASNYIDAISRSQYFKEIFSSDNLLVYKNEMFKDEIKILPKNATTIKDLHITPTFMKLNVNASNAFEIVLPAVYSEGWRAFLIENEIKYPLPRSVRFGTREIANSWYVNKIGNLIITIEYEPQKWFYYGLVVSLLTFTGCVLYLAEEPLHGLVSKIRKLKLTFIKTRRFVCKTL